MRGALDCWRRRIIIPNSGQQRSPDLGRRAPLIVRYTLASAVGSHCAPMGRVAGWQGFLHGLNSAPLGGLARVRESQGLVRNEYDAVGELTMEVLMQDGQQLESVKERWVWVFLPIWSGQALSLLGSQIAQFALIWWLTQTTGSGTVLAIAAGVGLLPGVLLGPVAGALVDRWNRRRVMIVADALSAIAAAVLAGLAWAGVLEIWHVYLVMFVRSIAGTFHFPAMQASTSLMVPHDQLSRVAGLNQMLQGAMNIIAPPVGALLLLSLPLPSMLMIDVITAAVAITPLLFVHIPQPQRATQPGEQPNMATDLREGLAYVWRWVGMRYILVMSALSNFLLMPAMSLLPLLVIRHFRGGALELSYISAAWWLGILIGGVLLSIWGSLRRRVLVAIYALIVMGLALLVPGLAPSSGLYMAVAGLLLAGVLNSICNGLLFATLQSIIPPEMQGRVFTIIGSAAMAMMPLGLAVAGPLSDQLGVQFWFALGGAACMLMGIVALMTPAVIRMEEQRVSVAAMAG